MYLNNILAFSFVCCILAVNGEDIVERGDGEECYDNYSCPAGQLCIGGACGSTNCFNVTITTRQWGHENSWTLGTCASDDLGYQKNQVYTEKCCLAAGKHTLTCEDTYKDGWHGGKIAIQGEEYCEDFTNGHEQKQDIDIISSVCENIAGDSTCDRYKANGGYCDHDHYDHWWMEINCRKTCNLCTEVWTLTGTGELCPDT